jgi:hypothetical protein
VETEDGGIAHVYLSPGEVTTSLGDNVVSISASGTYPFGSSLSYIINATAPLSFYVRIPTWASGVSTITGPFEASIREISPSENGLQEIAVPAGESTTFTIELDTQPRVQMRANNTAGVYYGALLYSLAIEYTQTETVALQYRTEAVLPSNTTNAHTHDHVMIPTSIWNVAIDPSQIEVVRKNVTDIPNPIWELGAPPVELRIAAVEIEWPLLYDTPDIPPLNPVVKGEPFSARFVPYASAKLHMAHLPVLPLPILDLKAKV